MKNEWELTGWLWVKSIPGKKNSSCKDPGVGVGEQETFEEQEGECDWRIEGKGIMLEPGKAKPRDMESLL